jgi:hypothetical protein
MAAVVDTLTSDHSIGMINFLTAVKEPARAALLDEGSGTSSSSHTACLVSALGADNLSLIQQQQKEEAFVRAYYPHMKISNLADIINESGQSNLQRLLDLLVPEFGQSTYLSKVFDSAMAGRP